MNKLLFMLCLAACLVLVARWSESQSSGQYPIADKVAAKVIEKYQTSTCEQLKAQKQEPPDPQKQAMTQKAVDQLKKDPAMRKHFLDKVASPIANKMFECGMIP